MSQRRLKDWLVAFQEFTQYFEAPRIYYFWSGVAAIAGALGRRVFIDQLLFRWYPNFYIILVGPSGMSKSEAISSAMGLLREVPGVHFGPTSLTWQALVEVMAESQEEVLTPDGDYETQANLTIYSRELGVLLDPTDREFIDILTHLWDGKDEIFQRRLRAGSYPPVENPCVNIIAGTTPTWIAENFPPSAVGGGFTSRCVFVFADRKARLTAYPKEIVEKLEGLDWWRQLREDLIHDLEIIHHLRGEFVLDDAAKALGRAWYEELHSSRPENLAVAVMDGYLARKQGLVHKLAMVLSAAYKNDLTITESDLDKAIQLVNAIEADMPKTFRGLKMDPKGAKVEEIVRIVETARHIPRNLLFRLAFQSLAISKRDFDEALSNAISAGILSQVLIGGVPVITLPVPDTPRQYDDR